MKPGLTPLRRFLLALAPAAALVLTLGFLAAAVHHHHDGTPQHDHCAVCIAGHTAAVPTAQAPAPDVPTLEGTCLAPASIAAPCSIAGTIHRGRAPPTA